MGFLKAILKSKKAGFAVFGVIVQIATMAGLSKEVADAVAQLIMVYIGSQGLVDTGKALKGSQTE